MNDGIAAQTNHGSEGEPSYESLIQSLEEIVRRLEEDGLSLDEAVAAFEDGMKLVQQCNDLLDNAELRITELSETHRRTAGQRADDYF